MEVLAPEITMTVSAPSLRALIQDLLLTVKVWERPEYWWSPAISRTLDAAIEASGIVKEEIDLYDFYS